MLIFRLHENWFGGMTTRKVCCWLLLFLITFGLSSGFYLPGVAPTDYPEGAELQVFANKLTSARSNVPYDFYFLPFCEPKEEKEKGLNIGQVSGVNFLKVFSNLKNSFS